MKNRDLSSESAPKRPLRPELEELLSRVMDACIDCPKCTGECAFLKKYGTPKSIAAAYDPSEISWLTLSFECSLCDLCAAVCPVNLNPGAMFLEMRREAVDREVAPLPAHKGIMAYERRGISRTYSWYSLPESCRTVFFPGCTFAGTRMDTAIALFEHLKTVIPDLGIVLDCCCKPSHDLGRIEFFHDAFTEMSSWLTAYGVETIMVACPNCYKVFATYGAPLEVVTVYEFLAENGLSGFGQATTADLSLYPVSIHDPCVLRTKRSIMTAVRDLAAAAGFSITEMPHGGEKTLCCGEGGAVGFVAPEFASRWGDLRRKEADERRLLTYCAGCAGFLNRKTPTDHVLDAIVHPEAVAAGKRKATKAPMTYINRIRLKRYLRKHHPAAVTRERNYTPVSGKAAGNRRGNMIKIIILTAIVAAIAGIRFAGIQDYFDADTLRGAVASSGHLAPAAYILLYAVAPSLFLPGLPITIVGGILFGPLWGVVYTIFGATAGACLAFLISRYVARDWIQARLTGPRWRQLDRSVEKKGWKIVAFTRLVPLFPFNLLNYAFGLTPIKFLPYAVTTFFGMLPACIAFIVFSSSLLDLFKGHISPGLIIGILLMIVVSLIPFVIRRFKHQQADNLEIT